MKSKINEKMTKRETGDKERCIFIMQGIIGTDIFRASQMINYSPEMYMKNELIELT